MYGITFGDMVGVAAKSSVTATFNYRPQLLAVTGRVHLASTLPDQGMGVSLPVGVARRQPGYCSAGGL